jgi:hypothetical protein
MDPTSRAILLCGGGGPSGPEYIGTYKFTTAREVFPNNFSASYQWQVPAQTNYIQAVAWGSGAYGNTVMWGSSYEFRCPILGGLYCGTDGGGGGFSTAVIPVTAGEILYVGVGSIGIQGSGSYQGNNVHNGGMGNAGGFTGIFRGSTPLIIAGGGGGGGQQGFGGAGGGTPAQNLFGAQSGSGAGSYLFGGSPHGGGGYQGGDSISSKGEGGTGYVTATNNLYTNTVAGTDRQPPEQTHPDYVPQHGTGGLNHVTNYLINYGWKQGLLVIHALGGGYDPANNPSTVIPSSRTILGTY